MKTTVVPLVQVPEGDSANFQPEDINVGRLLRFYGVRQPGAVFKVAGFYGRKARWFAKPRRRWADVRDVVRLIRLDGGEVRNIGVQYVALSSLWHLVDEPR